MIADPIVALATPPGRGALALIRLDGQGAFAVAARVIADFRAAPPRRATLATFRGPDTAPIDRGIYTVYPGRASYTGNDLVELSCHGGPAVVTQLLAALQAAGARPAAPGEFTRRALLNGKLDIVQAEAVGDLVAATAPAQARAALAQLDGALSRRLAELRAGLVDLQALLSYDIDFPEEDDGPIPAERIRARIGEVLERVRRLLATAPAGERLREGALVVLAGRPNAGKSSLFNALLGADRALVTEIPGTTRDAVEVATSFLGWPVRLADTAGIWDSPDRIDRMGIEVARRFVAAADVVLLCIEAGRAVGDDERALAERPGTVVVRTKADLCPSGSEALGEEISTSTVTGHGLDTVRKAVVDRAFATPLGTAELEQAITHERHRHALAAAAEELEAAIRQVDAGEAVLAAHHIRLATLRLDELVGAVDVEQVLDRMFGAFCVGK